MYRQMVRIRAFEEAANDLYRGAKMPGLTHLYIGQEAVAVGACEALRQDDFITSTHRGHGHCLAKGADVRRMFAELLGKEDGYCRGKGGSMHIADFENGNLGANAIVGGSAGIATGAAQSAKMRGTDQVVVCFFGEGALGQGLLYEVMNMAALWSLPVIYLCENNQYNEYTHYSGDDGRRASSPAPPPSGSRAKRSTVRTSSPSTGVVRRAVAARAARRRTVVRRREHVSLLRAPRRRRRPCVLPHARRRRRTGRRIAIRSRASDDVSSRRSIATDDRARRHRREATRRDRGRRRVRARHALSVRGAR